jgi:hypothetical protein
MGLLRRKRVAPTPAYADDGSLAVLVVAPDAARADSDVLREASAGGVDLARPLLVRHHLVLPADRVEEARELLAQDGYRLTVREKDVLAWRTQLLTALSASQERSRMAGLAQRLGGDVRGWDALGPG